ncbi:MAG: DUF922 domain-containing protein [Flavobacteriaceae bacterium]|nr:DUF922 domain-containing protein [Flavobacteriaceae bacterium]
MDKIAPIACFFLLGFFGSAQEIEQGVPWSKDVRLTWKDYKGTAPVADEAAATTASGISYTYSANLLHYEVHLDFEVNAYFYPSESWYRPKLCNENTLAHEQLHFDITEIFARKMRDKLRRTSFSDDVKAEVRKIYNDILKELQGYQERYDWETNFSRNREKQLEWNLKIAEALKKPE